MLKFLFVSDAIVFILNILLFIYTNVGVRRIRKYNPILSAKFKEATGKGILTKIIDLIITVIWAATPILNLMFLLAVTFLLNDDIKVDSMVKIIRRNDPNFTLGAEGHEEDDVDNEDGWSLDKYLNTNKPEEKTDETSESDLQE